MKLAIANMRQTEALAGNNRIPPPPVPPESHVILPKILHPTPPLPSSGW